MSNICELQVNRYFDPTNKYEIKNILYYTDPQGNIISCVVDFVRKSYEPEVNCNEYCEYNTYTEEEYEDCVEECKDSLKSLIIGSIEFDPITLEVKISTIPGTCYYVWAETTEQQEEREELMRYIEDIGCSYDESWIHVHEFAGPPGREYEEEYPAICYYHLHDCRLPKILSIINDKL